MFRDYLFFRRMITPLLIQACFWATVAGSIGFGVMTILGAIGGPAFDLKGLAAGAALILAGPIAARVYCEVLIILFSINENLVALRDGGARRRR